MRSTPSFTRVQVAVPVVGKIYASRRARVEPYHEEFLRAVLAEVLRLESGRLAATMERLTIRSQLFHSCISVSG
jgi:hypothetical protein